MWKAWLEVVHIHNYDSCYQTGRSSSCCGQQCVTGNWLSSKPLMFANHQKGEKYFIKLKLGEMKYSRICLYHLSYVGHLDDGCFLVYVVCLLFGDTYYLFIRAFYILRTLTFSLLPCSIFLLEYFVTLLIGETQISDRSNLRKHGEFLA